MNPLELTLGIMTAVGGFVDISELVFAAKAGSKFGYALLWVFAFATVGTFPSSSILRFSARIVALRFGKNYLFAQRLWQLRHWGGALRPASAGCSAQR